MEGYTNRILMYMISTSFLALARVAAVPFRMNGGRHEEEDKGRTEDRGGDELVKWLK